MKATFWVTFEGEIKGGAVAAVKATGLNQRAPTNARGIPIEFEVDLPDELFLGRAYKIDVSIPAPASGAVPTATPGSAWEAAKKRHGAS